MAAATKTNETAIVPVEQYAIVQMSADERAEAMEALAEYGKQLDVFDLTQIKVPGAGGTTWEVPTLDGVLKTEKLVGVILLQDPARNYWAKGIDNGGGNSPPDCKGCVNDEGVWVGKGYRYEGDNLVHLCETCELGQFGGPCKQSLRVVVQLPHIPLPANLNVPVTSIKPIRQYAKNLLANGISPGGAITGFTLTKAKWSGGVYSQIECSYEGRLVGEAKDAIKAWKDTIAPLLKQKAPSLHDTSQVSAATSIGTSFPDDDDLDEIPAADAGEKDPFAGE